ncbi:rCG53921, partial [Rattus norvegicus]
MWPWSSVRRRWGCWTLPRGSCTTMWAEEPQEPPGSG